MSKLQHDNKICDAYIQDRHRQFPVQRDDLIDDGLHGASLDVADEPFDVLRVILTWKNGSVM